VPTDRVALYSLQVGASGSALAGMFFLHPAATVVELLSFQGCKQTCSPDTTWHELGVSLGLHYAVLHETRWFGRTARPWDRREAMHVDTTELTDIVRCGVAAAHGGQKCALDVQRPRLGPGRRETP
jgi:hypothetical protein